MKMGTVIRSDYYITMKANRPFPWIGMPVYYQSISRWLIVDRTLEGLAEASGVCSLGTYSKTTDSSFILPGEPDAPKMDSSFVDKIRSSYIWGTTVKFSSGMWRYAVGCSEETMHEFLYLPAGETIDSMFSNNRNVVEVKDLKKLNTDGRLNCASCNILLTQCWMGVANLCYCPKCEG